MRLGIETDLAVVGETGKSGEALYLAQALAPEVILVDIGMRGAEGLRLVRHLRAAAPEAAVIVLTLEGDKDARVRAREAGAQAFLEKRGGAGDLLQAIRQLAPYRILSENEYLPAGSAMAELGLNLEQKSDRRV
jgi:DNA-binding NarL/FixJ family response regulator